MSDEYNSVSILLCNFTTEITSAYVTRNHVSPADLPSLVETIHSALSGLNTTVWPRPAANAPEPLTPTQICQSITPDALISFVDGRRYKALKRHLSAHGLDPAGYRQRYGLPTDYPMVSPEYSARRSQLARSAGLGQRRKAAEQLLPAAEGKRRVARAMKDE